MSIVVMETNVAEYPVRRGKVRDVYDLGDSLVLVATDRLSAFDCVFPNGIPDKGLVLTQLSLFWFDRLGFPHHVRESDLSKMPLPFAHQPAIFAGRTLWVEKTTVVPIECVARGYLAGSGWREYETTGRLAGVPLPPGLRQGDSLPFPQFTPATKAETGHDQNISIEETRAMVGAELARTLELTTLDLYQKAQRLAAEKGIVIADTKFEFGHTGDGKLILIDEVLTPDSSRFWDIGTKSALDSGAGYDKQFIRDWLETQRFAKEGSPPPLPPELVAETTRRYHQVFTKLTGRSLSNGA